MTDTLEYALMAGAAYHDTRDASNRIPQPDGGQRGHPFADRNKLCPEQFIKIIFMVAVLFLSHLAAAGTDTSNNGQFNPHNSQRVWLSSACYKLNLAVWDKLMNGPYLARYVVKFEDGRVFAAEKNGDDNSNVAEVVFPDDFHDEKTNLKAWINCRYGESYTWAIYANGVLIDSGTIAFSRKRIK